MPRLSAISYPELTLTVSVITLGIGCAGLAQAGVLKSVDFRGSGPKSFSKFYDLGDGLSLTVTGGTHTGGANADAPLNILAPSKITQGTKGLGVKSAPSDSSQLDAAGPDEFLRFTFSEAVDLDKVFFGNAGGNDEFDAGIDDVDILVNSTFGTDKIRNFQSVGGGLYRVNFSGGIDLAGDGTSDLVKARGTVFDFYTHNTNDDYRIAKMKVSTIPEPATLLGLLAVSSLAIATGRKRNTSMPTH